MSDSERIRSFSDFGTEIDEVNSEKIAEVSMRNIKPLKIVLTFVPRRGKLK